MTLIVMTPMSLSGVTPTSPPPLLGRDREGGKPQTLSTYYTPLPNPPPQGGREQASACCKLTALALIAIYSITIPGSALAAGDAAAGRRKAVQCQTCHGLNGLSKIPEAPNLAGQPELYLVKSLNDFRQGVRRNEMMSIVSQALSDADVDDLAAYYAAIEISVTPKP